jgi:hypothetical protein
MALTFTLIDSWDDGRRVHVVGTAAASGSYTAGRDTLDLSPNVPTTQPPIVGTAWMDGLAGYDYRFTLGAAINSGTVKIFQEGRGRTVCRTCRRRVPGCHHRRHRHFLRHLPTFAVAVRGGSESFEHSPRPGFCAAPRRAIMKTALP